MSDNNGRHGGNHNQADSRKDRNPNRLGANTDAESLAGNRNVGRAGDTAFGADGDDSDGAGTGGMVNDRSAGDGAGRGGSSGG